MSHEVESQLLSELYNRLKFHNLMFMITDQGFQVIDKSTDEEFDFVEAEPALELIAEYQRHHEERKRILKASS